MENYKEKLDKLHESVCKEGYDQIGLDNISKKFKVGDNVIVNGKKGKIISRYAVDELADIKFNDGSIKKSVKYSNIKKESFSKEELKVDTKYSKQLKDNNIDCNKVGDKLLVDESDSKRLNGLGIPYKEKLDKLHESVCKEKMYNI
jgi:hypothetical protein